MGMIVKNGYLPGFTEPERNPDLESYLTMRGYCAGTGPEGAEIAHIFHGRIEAAGIPLVAGAEGFKNLGKQRDARNKIIASCAKHNCMTSIWWLVECECTRKWTIYSGCWNEDLDFMVLDSPCYHPYPLVWLTEDRRRLRPLLDLASV